MGKQVSITNFIIITDHEFEVLGWSENSFLFSLRTTDLFLSISIPDSLFQDSLTGLLSMFNVLQFW
jgi:hypothetical protein